MILNVTDVWPFLRFLKYRFLQKNVEKFTCRNFKELKVKYFYKMFF